MHAGNSRNMIAAADTTPERAHRIAQATLPRLGTHMNTHTPPALASASLPDLPCLMKRPRLVAQPLAHLHSGLYSLPSLSCW
jgi:hypothetical protein